MARDVARDWMWSEACEMLARAERLHREFFRPAGSAARRRRGSRRWTFWRPIEVLVLVALPGVNAERFEASIEGSDLVISGTRVLAGGNADGDHSSARIAARAVRAARAASGRALQRRAPVVADGCLMIALQKAGAFRG